MIKSFRHKGLEDLFRTGSTRGVQADHVKKLRRILALLNTISTPEEITLPSYNLHQLQGQRSDIWSVKVNGNWRVTFRFDNGNAEIVNYEDYH